MSLGRINKTELKTVLDSLLICLSFPNSGYENMYRGFSERVLKMLYVNCAAKWGVRVA